MTQTTEVWKEVPGFPAYKASNMGKVMSYKRHPEGALLSTRGTTNGYVYLILCNGKKRYCTTLHKLVGELFIRPLKKGEIYHHKDHVRYNCAVSNIEIKLRSDNTREAMESGNNTAPWSGNGKSKRLCPAEVKEIRRRYDNKLMSMRQLAVEYSRNITSMWHICNRKSYTGKPQVTRITDEGAKEIKKMLNDGYTISNIITRTGHSIITIENIKYGRTYLKA